MCGSVYSENPEILLAKNIKAELGIDVNPQALRMYIRHNWTFIASTAHAIHGPAKLENKKPGQ